VVRDFLVNLEKTEASRSYKIALLFAMLDDDVLVLSRSLKELTDRVADLAKRVHRLAEDFSVDLSDKKNLRKLLIDNPVRAFVEGRGMGGSQYFKFDGENFAFALEIPDLRSGGQLIREILDWRLAQYLSRGEEGDFICRVSRNTGGAPMLFLPSRSGASLPEGPLEVEVDGRPMEAIVAKIAVNVVRASGSSTNELPMILRSWFGDDAGLPGRGDRVRFRRGALVVMEPIGVTSKLVAGLKLWERYAREAIPQAFGLQFNTGIWNVGFVVSRPHVFLLVTLKKEDMNEDHQYSDHFLSDEEFQWQSQRRTTRRSMHGQMLHDHRAMGLHVHLFVRSTKKIGQRPNQFTYCGEVDFVSWEGDSPITVRWRLRARVPESLGAILGVPV
jgi:hypothetical protein